MFNNKMIQCSATLFSSSLVFMQAVMTDTLQPRSLMILSHYADFLRRLEVCQKEIYNSYLKIVQNFWKVRAGQIKTFLLIKFFELILCFFSLEQQHTDFDLLPDILKHFKDSLAHLLEGEKETKEHAETSNDSKKIIKLRKGNLKELQQVNIFIGEKTLYKEYIICNFQ